MRNTCAIRDEISAAPIIDLSYSIDINAEPSRVWPWIVQVGYHRGGWYIDRWWDRIEQDVLWPLLVPAKDRGCWRPPADSIIAEYQSLKAGDIIPDGPPGSAYYEVLAVERERLLALRATTHFKYMAPRFLIGTRFQPTGEFRWEFRLQRLRSDQTRLTSRWRGWGEPRFYMMLVVRPVVWLIDHLQQPEILKGIKRRCERGTAGRPSGT